MINPEAIKRVIRMMFGKKNYSFFHPLTAWILVHLEWLMPLLQNNPITKPLIEKQVEAMGPTAFYLWSAFWMFLFSWFWLRSLQRFFGVDGFWTATLKGFLGALIVIIPTPITGSMIGGAVLAWEISALMDQGDKLPPLEELPYLKTMYHVFPGDKV